MAKKWLIIDAHHHFFPKEAVDKLGFADGNDYAADLAGRFADRWKSGMSIERSIEFMDESGIDMALINQSTWSPVGLALCQAMNDGYAKAANKYPGRFIACAHVPLEAGSDTLNELERAVNGLGLGGVSLVSSTSKTTLDSKELFPLYEKISRLDVPVIIHPTLRRALWGGGAKYLMNISVSREYDIAKATVEILYGVLNKFSDLRFVMPHLGGCVLALKGRIKARYEPEGWDGPENIKGLPKTPRQLKQTGLDNAFEELFGRLYFDTAGFVGDWVPVLKLSIMTVRTDRLCFGTDYPFDLVTEHAQDVRGFIDDVKRLDISETEKRGILGDNIRTLFRLG